MRFLHSGSGHGPDSFAGGDFRYEDLLPGKWDVTISWGPEGRWQMRNLQVILEEDKEDFFYRLEESVPVRFEVSLPTGAAATEGVLRATCGLAVVSKRARLSWRNGRTLHHRLFETVDHYQLDLAAGEWNVELELLGYDTWRKMLSVEERALGNVHVADMLPQSGRTVTTTYDSRYFRIDARRSAAEPWQLLLWKDRRSPVSLVSVPPGGIAFLPAGEYDVRIQCLERVTKLLQSVVVEASIEPLVLDVELDEGLAIQGTVVTSTGSPWVGPLHLSRFGDDGQWKQLGAKEHLGHPEGKLAFRGLSPGAYRTSLDRDEEAIVADWYLTDRNLVDQRIVAAPLR